MMKTSRPERDTARRLGLPAVIFAVVVLGSSLTPTAAICSYNNRITSNFQYVKLPGLCPFDYPCASGEGSITPAFEGFFWQIGRGDPRPGVGMDNGASPALAGPGPDFLDGWVMHYASYNSPAYIDTLWAHSSLDDSGGCGGPPPGECTAMLLQDQLEGDGYFAYLTAAQNPYLDYFFTPPDGAAIELALLPTADVTRVRRGAAVVAEVAAPKVPAAGLYPDLSGDCEFDGPVAYRVYQQAVDAGSPPPLSRSIDDGWTLAESVIPKSGAAIPADHGTLVTLACPDRNVDVYLAISLVFDSGFESILGRNAAPIPVLPQDCRGRVWRPGPVAPWRH